MNLDFVWQSGGAGSPGNERGAFGKGGGGAERGMPGGGFPQVGLKSTPPPPHANHTIFVTSSHECLSSTLGDGSSLFSRHKDLTVSLHF